MGSDLHSSPALMKLNWQLLPRQVCCFHVTGTNLSILKCFRGNQEADWRRTWPLLLAVIFATVGAIASFLILPMILLGFLLSSLGAMFFVAWVKSAFFLVFPMILFGLVLPVLGYQHVAVLTLLSAVVPTVCFAFAAILGARVMDSFLPMDVAPDLADLYDFDKRLYQDVRSWSPGEAMARDTHLARPWKLKPQKRLCYPGIVTC